MQRNLLARRLRFFAAPTDGGSNPSGGDGGSNPPRDPKPTPPPKKDPEPGSDEKKFSEADIERIVAGRLAKYGDYDAIKQELADLKAANATEAERAALAAREEGKSEAQKAGALALAAVEFRLAAKGRVEDEQVSALLEDLNLANFVNDKGEVDTERVQKKIDALVPAKQEPNRPGLSGGARNPAKPEPSPGMDRMRAAYAEKETS